MSDILTAETFQFGNNNNNASLRTEDGKMNFDELIDKETRDVVTVVNYIIICGSVASFGIASNVVNLLVFSKQGYNNTVNISLSGIAISDMCTLITIIWFGICANPLLNNSGTPVAFSEILYLTAAWPHCLFARITCIITVFITVERFLCVAIPLKIKNVITKTKTVVAVFSIFVSQLMTAIPTYLTTYMDWKFFPTKNRSLLGIKRNENWDQVENASLFLQSIMQAGSFILLIGFTGALLINLRRQKKWRSSSASNSRKADISTRDKKLVTMVILIALILIICFTPGMVLFTVVAVVPEFQLGEKYDNLFWVMWWFPFIFQTTNSSVNIFVYYSMSSKYRETFQEIFIKYRKPLHLCKTVQSDS